MCMWNQLFRRLPKAATSIKSSVSPSLIYLSHFHIYDAVDHGKNVIYDIQGIICEYDYQTV